MSTAISFNGVTYQIPAIADSRWGSQVSAYLIAISTGTLQKSGGDFTLTNDLNFGASYGLAVAYLRTRTSNPSTAGLVRLAVSDTIGWRNNANSANLLLAVNGSNQLTFNGTAIQNTLSVSDTTTIDLTLAGDVLSAAVVAGSLVNADINASAAIAYSKLNLATSIVNADISASAAIAFSKLAALSSGNILVGSAGNVATSVAVTGDVTISNLGVTAIAGGAIVNADVNASAAIAYSKLALTGNIVNADISASAAIAYSKLNLATSIVNADISGSAAIAYSKLNLATSIVNADISGSAAIAYSKLSLTGAIVNADVSGSAAIAYSKLNLATSIVNADVNASAAIALSKLAAVTASRALVSDASGFVSASAVTATQLAYLSGASGTTGTGSLVYSAAPTFTGAMAGEFAGFTGEGNPTFFINNPTASAGSNTRILNLRFNVDTDCTGGYFIQFAGGLNTNAIGKIEATGTGASVAYTTTSDKRLKSKLSPIDGLALLEQIEIGSFQWLSKPGGRPRKSKKGYANYDQGGYAQDIYKVMPHVVSKGSDEVDEKGFPTHPWAIDYSRFVPSLISAVQILSAKIKDLEAKLQTAK